MRNTWRIGWYGTACPEAEHWPSSHVTRSVRKARRNSCRRRDFPTPASPTTLTTCPRPDCASRKRSFSSSRSRSRPTNGVSPRSAATWKRLRLPRTPVNRCATTDSERPLIASGPRESTRM